MTDDEVRSFLAQLDEAAQRMKQWPQWMQDAAYEAAATFPRPVGVTVGAPRLLTFNEVVEVSESLTLKRELVDAVFANAIQRRFMEVNGIVGVATPAQGPAPSWVCPKCKVDRFKAPCGDPHRPPCPMTAGAASKGKRE